MTADAANIVRFEVVPSSVLTASMGNMRQEAGSRATRQRQRSVALPSAANEALRSARASLYAAEGSSSGQDAVSRLALALNDCDVVQSAPPPQQQPQPQQPNSTAQRSLHHSLNTPPCGGSMVLQTPSHSHPHHHHRPPSERGRRRAGKDPLPAHVVDLTRGWVAAERAEAAAMAATVSSRGEESMSSLHTVKMPAFHAVPTHTAPLSNSSVIMRLHKGKFDPLPPHTPETSAATASATAAAMKRASRPASASALESRLLAEPVHSYRILKDATTPLLDLHPTSRIPLLEAAQMRRANLERLTHNFEHQRYVLHGELEEALEWRGQCQAAIMRRRSSDSSTEEKTPLSSSSLHTPRPPTAPPNTDEIYQGLLDEVFTHRSFRSAKARRGVPVSSTAIGFRSAWTKEAVRQALDLEKSRLTRLLRAYDTNCGAAALTLAAVEDLRAETIRRVWHPEDFASSRGSAVFYREHFLAYVQIRYPLNLPTLSATVGGERPPHEILDALPSKAEASFAKFAYESLPSAEDDA